MTNQDQRTARMTAQALIDLLSKHDPNLPVYIRGYEDGVDDVAGVAEVQVARDVHLDAWYYGNHSTDVHEDEGDESEPGLHIYA